MKKKLLPLVVLISMWACKQEHIPRKISSVDIQQFKIDSTSIRALLAIDTETVIFAGSEGDIGISENGGKSWDITTLTYQDSIQPHFRSIAKTENSIFALSIANPALLYKIDFDSQKIVYQEEHPDVFYDSMTFLDNEIGIAIGDPIDGCTSIIMTYDGGNTWQKIPCDQLPKVEDGEASFAASNTNIAFYNNHIWVVTGGSKARVLRSSDKGKNWEIYDTPMIQGTGAQGIYSVDFYNENIGIIIGGDYSNPSGNIANKAITKDGGKTWTLVADGKNPSYKSCVQYIPGSSGKEVIAVGKTGVSFSNDGGVSWTEISEEKYYAIQFVNKDMAWLSGNGKIGKLILD